jgi:hypothetical protein
MPVVEVMKYAALSANTVTEEPIDVVLHDSYPDQVPLSSGMHALVLPADDLKLLHSCDCSGVMNTECLPTPAAHSF